MNSFEKNYFSLKNRKISGIQNKEELISLISKNSLKQNKFRVLNVVDKSAIINNLDGKIKQLKNESKYNSNTSENISNKKRIFNKIVINQIKKEKEFLKTKTNIQNLPGSENNKNLDNKDNMSVNNNINSYNSKMIVNDKKKKKKYAMESHHLINYLLKNQKNISKKEKAINNELELSFSSSFENNKKNKIDLSSNKDSKQLNNINESNKTESLPPKKFRKINQTNPNIKTNNNNSLNENENNIYHGINKENKDINLIKNTRDVLISPLYSLDNNNNDSYNKRNRMFRSPLRMADIFKLKKNHSINSILNDDFTNNNNIKEASKNSNKLKKIMIMKKEQEKEKEKTLVENIKRIRNLKVNLIIKEKENVKNNDNFNINLENKKEYKEIKEETVEINKKIKKLNSNNDIKINTKKEENNYSGRNKLIPFPNEKFFSQTTENKFNKTSISFNCNKININIKTISPIKPRKDTKKIIDEERKDAVSNIRIKVNKKKLEKTTEQKVEQNNKNYEDKPVNSIRRRFMNSKNKYNNNQTQDLINQKIINTENDIKANNINIEENKKIQNTEADKKPTVNIINSNKDINLENKNIKEDKNSDNINQKEEENIKTESNLQKDILKNEEPEIIPEIKFQSESEKENRMKIGKKYRSKKAKEREKEKEQEDEKKKDKETEKEKEKENKDVYDIKNEDRNIRPIKTIRKYNSFSFGTLFALNGKKKKRRVIGMYKKNEINKEEEKLQNEEDDKDSNMKIVKRNLSPECKNINKNKLNIFEKEEETRIKTINSEKYFDKNILLNIKTKTKKKVIITKEIKIEEINTAKPVVRYKITQLLHYTKLKNNQLNNDNNKIKKYDNIYIFGFDQNNLIKFDLRKKRFNRIKISEIEDISDSFLNNYKYENTLLCNTLTGIFILTGENTNILYYYDKKYEIIIKLCQFSSAHNSGCLLLDNDKIFIFSGNNNKICEYYDFNREKIESIPELNYDRMNSSFCFCKNNIYAFFGYSCIKKQYLFNIEYIDKNQLDKWNEINLNIEENKLIDNDIINASLFKYDKEPNKIFIYGGKRGINDTVIEGYYYIYDIEKNNFEKIEDVFYNIRKEYKRFTVKKFQEENKKYYFFDKQKQFIELSEEFELDINHENISAIIDYDNNIHFLTKNRNYINLCQSLK